MRILFAGYLQSTFNTSWQRFDTLRHLGCDVIPLDQSPLSDLRQRRWRRRFDGRAFCTENVQQLNGQLRAAIKKESPKVVWIEKGLLVQPETLAQIRSEHPDVRLVSYQDDNPFGARGYENPFWRHFTAGIDAYHLHFVKRPADVAEFRRRGAARVEIFTTGFYAVYGRQSATAPAEFRHQVSFVGTALDNRSQLFSRLLRAGVNVDVYGGRWNRHWSYYWYRRRFHGILPESDRSEVIWRSRINLAFVSHSNGDEYNGRSFDIPGSAGFLLAERTPAHQSFYAEGSEAEFFGSMEELIDKVRFYLGHEDARAAVARRGHERAMKEDYSLQRRLRDAIAVVKTLS